MFHILLALHLLFAIFAIGPLVHAAATAARGVRTGDATATASSARTLRIYAYVSLLVVIAGFWLMSVKPPNGAAKHVAEFSDTFIWLSFVLWLVAVGLVLGGIVPALRRITAAIGRQESVAARTTQVIAASGIVSVIFAVIVFLMVYQPGR